MLSTQLGRALLASPRSSADRDDARVDEDGSYGELVEAIDRIVEPTDDEPAKVGRGPARRRRGP